MADKSDEQGVQILKQYLSSFSASSDLPGDAAKDTAKTLLNTYDNDVQEFGAVILEFVQGRESEGELEAIAKVIPAVQSETSKSDFEQFGWAVRDAWNYFDPEGDKAEDQAERENWRRLNAFVALLAAKGDGSLLLNGLWTLRSALEDEEGVEGNLPAAAMWAINAGKVIYESDETFKSGDSKGGDPAKAGDKYNGESGFNKQRWAFWKQAFVAATSKNERSERVRDWAKKAVVAMSKIEDS